MARLTAAVTTAETQQPENYPSVEEEPLSRYELDAKAHWQQFLTNRVKHLEAEGPLALDIAKIRQDLQEVARVAGVRHSTGLGRREGLRVIQTGCRRPLCLDGHGTGRGTHTGPAGLIFHGRPDGSAAIDSVLLPGNPPWDDDSPALKEFVDISVVPAAQRESVLPAAAMYELNPDNAARTLKTWLTLDLPLGFDVMKESGGTVQVGPSKGPRDDSGRSTEAGDENV